MALGADTLSGGGSQGDIFQYRSAGDAGDEMTDFTVSGVEFELAIANGSTHNTGGVLVAAFAQVAAVNNVAISLPA